MLEGTANNLKSLEIKVESQETGLGLRDQLRAQWSPCAQGLDAVSRVRWGESAF